MGMRGQMKVLLRYQNGIILLPNIPGVSRDLAILNSNFGSTGSIAWKIIPLIYISFLSNLVLSPENAGVHVPHASYQTNSG
jgi:hypothetical protein